MTSFGNPLVDRFTPASRSFRPGSYALGALWNVAPGWQLSSNLAQTGRAPKDYELFADGAHVATMPMKLAMPTWRWSVPPIWIWG